MAATMDNLSKEYDKWLRVMILIDYGGRQLCNDILFNREGLSTDGVCLREELRHLTNLNNDQREKVFPRNGEPDFNTFDVTLLTDIIKLKFRGKYRSFVHDLKSSRNDIFHRGNKELSIAEFQHLWGETSSMLQRYGFDLKSVGDLKFCGSFSHQEYRDIIKFILQGTVYRFLLP